MIAVLCAAEKCPAIRSNNARCPNKHQLDFKLPTPTEIEMYVWNVLRELFEKPQTKYADSTASRQSNHLKAKQIYNI